jgi:UDP-N-acetylmuramate dehydrogenase
MTEERDEQPDGQVLLDSVAAVLDGIPDLTIERHVPASGFCTYRVGGPLNIVARVGSSVGLAAVAATLAEFDVPYLTIGKGSNLLVADRGFPGVALLLGDAFSEIAIDGTTVHVGAAAALPVVARATVSAGLSGFEWAVGVPGSIGGAVRMNAGGHGSDMAASLVSVEIADLSFGGLVHRGAESLHLGYRSSNLAPWQIVSRVTLELSMADESTRGDETLREIVAWRHAHQPGGANAGSVFTNPPDDSAGRLIDEAGLKGRRVGTAEVSDKHANFIQVDADGSADDVVQLMVEIVDRVQATYGVRLHAETRLIGFEQDLVDHVQKSPQAEGE